MDKRAPGLKPKDLVGIPWRVAFELQRRGWWLRSDCVWAKPNPMPESVVDRPTRSHEYVFLLTKSERYFYDSDAVRTPYAQATMPEIGAKYSGVAAKAFREYRAQDASEAKRSMVRSLKRHRGANLRSAWWIPTQPYPAAHFATFPETLPEICIRAGISERGCCPACGSAWHRKVSAEGGTIGHDWHPDKTLSKGRCPRDRRSGIQQRNLPSCRSPVPPELRVPRVSPRSVRGAGPVCRERNRAGRCPFARAAYGRNRAQRRLRESRAEALLGRHS